MVVLKSVLAGVAAAVLLAAGSAQAAPFHPVSVTASSQYPTFEAGYAIDTNPNTDWAANGSGVGSYLNIDLGAIYNLTFAFVTDRVTSGSTNPDPVLGSLDFTYAFQIQATDAFYNPIGGPVTVSGLNPPPTGAATIVALAMTTQYLRYTVLQTDGDNPGLADIQFDGTLATPIPGALPLFAGGLGVIALLARRRKRNAEAA